MLIERTHRAHIALGCAAGALLHVSPSMAWSLANGLAVGVGSVNERLVGFIDFAGCGSATSAAPTFIRPSFRSHARSSVGGSLNGNEMVPSTLRSLCS